MSTGKRIGRTRVTQIAHRTGTPGVYFRNGYYIVLTRPDGVRKVRHRFGTYEDAVAFKATTPNRHTLHKPPHAGEQPSQRRRQKRLLLSTSLSVAYLRNDPCSYCGGPSGERDHIIPRSNDGDNDWTNLTAACRSCNIRKRDTPLLLFLAYKNGCWRWHQKNPDEDQVTPGGSDER